MIYAIRKQFSNELFAHDTKIVNEFTACLSEIDASKIGNINNEDLDYYGITDETSCPLCELGHDDEESIEGRYKAGSYFIKCEQREIEIVA